MAKQNMILRVIEALLTLLVSLAVGGLFLSGSTQDYFILSYLPEIVHTVVGYAIYVLAVLGIVIELAGK